MCLPKRLTKHVTYLVIFFLVPPVSQAVIRQRLPEKQLIMLDPNARECSRLVLKPRGISGSSIPESFNQILASKPLIIGQFQPRYGDIFIATKALACEDVFCQYYAMDYDYCIFGLVGNLILRDITIFFYMKLTDKSLTRLLLFSYIWFVLYQIACV